jgi:hypothetical protein
MGFPFWVARDISFVYSSIIHKPRKQLHPNTMKQYIVNKVENEVINNKSNYATITVDDITVQNIEEFLDCRGCKLASTFDTIRAWKNYPSIRCKDRFLKIQYPFGKNKFIFTHYGPSMGSKV